MKSKLIVITVTVIIAALNLQTINAYGLNTDYLSKEKWTSNENVISEEIHNTSAGDTIDGIFMYYIDSKNASVYTFFKLKGTRLTEGNKFVAVSYVFKTEDETYSFSVDKNGIQREFSPYEATVFDARANFDFSENTYISAAQYTGGVFKAEVMIKFYDGARSYLIKENLIIDSTPETTLKTTAEKTTKPTTQKTTVQRTTAQKTTTVKATNKTATEKTAKGRSTTAPTTKFTPSNHYTTSAVQTTKYTPTAEVTSESGLKSEAEEITETESSSADAEYPESGGTSLPAPQAKLSGASKVTLAGASSAAAAGVGILVFSLIKRKR